MGMQPEKIRELAKVGADILFVMPNGDLRPGKIVRKWPETSDPTMVGYCNAVIFLDGTNDCPSDASPEDRAKYQTCLMWATSIYHTYPWEPRPGGFLFPQEVV